MSKPLRILMVQASRFHSEVIAEVLRRAGYEPIWERVETREAMVAALGRAWDVILSDHRMPNFSASDALALVRGRRLETPFIVVSSQLSEEEAAAIMGTGAQDHIPKENLNRLSAAIERVLQEVEDREARARAREEMEVTSAPRGRSLRERCLSRRAERRGDCRRT